VDVGFEELDLGRGLGDRGFVGGFGRRRGFLGAIRRLGEKQGYRGEEAQRFKRD